MKTIEIKNAREIFAVYTNTDPTEGRGYEYPVAYAENEMTAKRLGAGRYVQGTCCPIKRVTMFLIGHTWYAPVGLIHRPTEQDLALEKKVNEDRAKEMLLAKFKSGEELTKEERNTIIELIGKNK